ncbi:hypothetical protein MP228_002248 [Amoeboaphelidium protococcarum]|nr:hypothetical protein MP228_002248 [Amoeboaphelidium protococcarum]
MKVQKFTRCSVHPKREDSGKGKRACILINGIFSIDDRKKFIDMTVIDSLLRHDVYDEVYLVPNDTIPYKVWFLMNDMLIETSGNLLLLAGKYREYLSKGVIQGTALIFVISSFCYLAKKAKGSLFQLVGDFFLTFRAYLTLKALSVVSRHKQQLEQILSEILHDDQYTEVDFIAHSHGGMVLNRLIHDQSSVRQLLQQHRDKVKLIYMGSPECPQGAAADLDCKVYRFPGDLIAGIYGGARDAILIKQDPVKLLREIKDPMYFHVLPTYAKYIWKIADDAQKRSEQ